MAMQFFGRSSELKRLESFVNEKKSGFLIIRGRRRIGKSWLLREFSEKVRGFKFQGDDDSSSKQLMKKMANEWALMTGDDTLSIIRMQDLSWLRIFNHMTQYFSSKPKQKHVLIFDEIQWIAKRRSGFLSQLKEVWVEWERLGNVKIIICGSSQRFFTQKVSKETSIIHRMRTTADLHIKPFSLAEIKKYYFPKWTNEEICLVFMMTGGVPYYLERIPADDNFIRAINRTFFTQDTIFLDEFKELLNIEFTSGSIKTAEKIMACLGQDGSTFENIRKKSKISNESTVRSMMDQLLEFDLVLEKSQSGKVKANRRGSKYYIRDPFLNFYFQVLRGKSELIRQNTRKNLFRHCIGSKSGYYIEGFTGKAFELLTEWILRREVSPSGKERIFKKLNLEDYELTVGHHWEENVTQVDLIVESEIDRESRLMELKWINSTATSDASYIEQVREKEFSPPKGWTISYHLLISSKPSASLLKNAEKERVQVLHIDDLFSE